MEIIIPLNTASAMLDLHRTHFDGDHATPDPYRRVRVIALKLLLVPLSPPRLLHRLNPRGGVKTILRPPNE